jgi:ornithine carbamoyltransferase
MTDPRSGATIAAMSPATSASPACVLELSDLDARELEALLDLGATMQHHPLAWRHRLEGRTVACVLNDASLPVHTALAVAVHRLGALPVVLEAGGAPDEEAHLLSAVCDAIVLSAATQRRLRRIADDADVPVVNAGNADHDPCRALAACLALRDQFGTLDGLKVAWVGPADGLVHSLLQAAPLAGLQLRLSCPPGRLADPWIIASGGRAVHVADSAQAAVEDAHVVISPAMVDALDWAPMTQALLYALITGDWEVPRC